LRNAQVPRIWRLGSNVLHLLMVINIQRIVCAVVLLCRDF
jgi:hypothetical protein